MTRNLASTMGRFLVLLALSSSAILAQPVAVSAAGPIGGWVAGPPMAGPRDSHTVTTLKDGRILVVGGGAEIYDPTANRWSQAGTPVMARTIATATLLAGGRVLVAAGIVGERSVPNTEIYDPTRNTWTAAASMAGRRYDHTATLLADGRVLIAGGTRSTVTLDSAELYDQRPMPGPRRPAYRHLERTTRRPFCQTAGCWWREAPTAARRWPRLQFTIQPQISGHQADR